MIRCLYHNFGGTPNCCVNLSYVYELYKTPTTCPPVAGIEASAVKVIRLAPLLSTRSINHVTAHLHTLPSIHPSVHSSIHQYIHRTFIYPCTHPSLIHTTCINASIKPFTCPHLSAALCRSSCTIQMQKQSLHVKSTSDSNPLAIANLSHRMRLCCTPRCCSSLRHTTHPICPSGYCFPYACFPYTFLSSASRAAT